MIEHITANADEYVQIAAYVVAIAAIIAAITTNDVDNKWVARARKLLDLLAFNVGKAKNEIKKK